MIVNTLLPPALYSMIGNEKVEFAVKAGRAVPYIKSLPILGFGLVWTAFTSIFVLVFLGPLFMGKEVHFESNGVPVTASPDNLGPAIAPAIIIGVFVLIGLGMMTGGLVMLFKKGGYYVGTPSRLIHYRKGKFRSIDWEQFSGDITVHGTALKGHVALQMRTGRMVKRKYKPARYVPDVIYMSGIPEAFKIEKLCRKRIKENDPTPPSTGS
jgi:hypothetical protein